MNAKAHHRRIAAEVGEARERRKQKKKDKAKKDTPQSRGTFKMGTKAS